MIEASSFYKDIFKILADREVLNEPDNNPPDKAYNDNARALFVILSSQLPKGMAIEDALTFIDALGYAPSLINDDQGHWAVGGDGMQNVTDPTVYETEETYFSSSWDVKPGMWKRDLREAVIAYVNGQLSESV